ncbi:MAG TPA: c-type cytochrome [Fimbriimonadaceae bacterium]|nr:c-type cytochrome [Fimbriimonadaceae bacterium]
MTSAPSTTGKRSDPLQGFATGLFVLVVAELLAGLFLEARYRADAEHAYASVNSMAGPMGWFRSFHYWSSSLLIAGSLIALVWMIVARRFERSHGKTWLSMACLYAASMVSQITGNLLPFDRHGVETAVVESGIAGRTPVAGATLQSLILHGNQFSDQTVRYWHMAHVCAWVVGAAGAALFWFGANGTIRNRALMWIPLALGALLGLAIRAPLGSPGSPADYGSYDAQVSWYNWPLHGSLNLFSRLSTDLGWVGSVVMPGLLALVIVTAPFVSRWISAKVIQAVFAIFGAYFLVAALFFGGRFAPLVGNRDPIASTSPAPSSQAAGAADPVLYAKGRSLFNSNECSGCHGQDGRSGGDGPSLLGVAQRRGSDPSWYMQFIKDPTSKDPNTMMPAFPSLSSDETRAIAEFLIHQKP